MRVPYNHWCSALLPDALPPVVRPHGVEMDGRLANPQMDPTKASLLRALAFAAHLHVALTYADISRNTRIHRTTNELWALPPDRLLRPKQRRRAYLPERQAWGLRATPRRFRGRSPRRPYNKQRDSSMVRTVSARGRPLPSLRAFIQDIEDLRAGTEKK